MSSVESVIYSAFADEFVKIAKAKKNKKDDALRNIRDLAIGAGAFGVGSATGAVATRHLLPKLLKKHPKSLPLLAALPIGALTGGGTMLYLKSLESKRKKRGSTHSHK